MRQHTQPGTNAVQCGEFSAPAMNCQRTGHQIYASNRELLASICRWTPPWTKSFGISAASSNANALRRKSPYAPKVACRLVWNASILRAVRDVLSENLCARDTYDCDGNADRVEFRPVTIEKKGDNIDNDVAIFKNEPRV